MNLRALIFASIFFTAPQLCQAGESSSDQNHGCSKFKWAPLKGISEHAAIMLPVNINGSSQLLQLDTGAHTSVLKKNISIYAEELGWIAADTKITDLSLELGNAPLNGRNTRIFRHLSGNGLLGLSSLAGYNVIIDYPHQSICVVSQDDWTSQMDTDYNWIPARIINGHITIRARVDNGEPGDMVFDTGLGFLSLTMDTNGWSKIVGNLSSTNDLEVINLTSWGRDVAIQKSTSSHKLNIEGVIQKNIPIYRDKNNLFKIRDRDVEGILGNSVFESDILVLRLVDTKMAIGVKKKITSRALEKSNL